MSDKGLKVMLFSAGPTEAAGVVNDVVWHSEHPIVLNWVCPVISDAVNFATGAGAARKRMVFARSSGSPSKSWALNFVVKLV